eukprot:CAMPEP_0178914360 /NCGR_PEP_ID=MMETSP0786-20121207/11383_1 /TAXON_ID=186022 /ORGANISM="Thalassionema frauenfeldii, Strain CCMP 1798" /LENGTH=450 /DNA_ID=CAMNT_0020587261 /DNA_START=214 /DNA_END=1566 /DNA_ORIENTATION=+
MNMSAPRATTEFERLTPLGLGHPPDWARNMNMEHFEQELDLELPPPPPQPQSTGLQPRPTTKIRENHNSNSGRRNSTTRSEAKRRSPVPNGQRYERRRESISPTPPGKSPSARERRNPVPKGLNKPKSRQSISPKNPTVPRSSSTEFEERRHRDQRVIVKDPKRKLRHEQLSTKAPPRAGEHIASRRGSATSRNLPNTKEGRRVPLEHHHGPNGKQRNSRRGSVESTDERARNFHKQDRRSSRRDSGGSQEEKQPRVFNQQGLPVNMDNQPSVLPPLLGSVHSKSVGASDCATCEPKEKRRNESDERRPRIEIDDRKAKLKEIGDIENNRRSNRRNSELPDFEIRFFKEKTETECTNPKNEQIIDSSSNVDQEETRYITEDTSTTCDNSTLYSGYGISIADSDCATCNTPIPEAIHENTGLFGSDDSSLTAVNRKSHPPSIHVNSPRITR